MPGNDDADYAFDKVPRGPLRMTVTRRQFLPAMVTEFLAWSEKDSGKNAFKLADLGTFSDGQLAAVVPVITAGSRISVKDNFVWGQPPKAQRTRRLFPVRSPAAAAFNQFNGERRLDACARNLAQATGWNSERSFAYVRGLFLCLVLVGLSHPRDGSVH
jgi:hypothetical protein